MIEDRVISPEYDEEIDTPEVEVSLRPRSFSEYIGQTKVKENMKIYIATESSWFLHILNLQWYNGKNTDS